MDDLCCDDYQYTIRDHRKRGNCLDLLCRPRIFTTQIAEQLSGRIPARMATQIAFCPQFSRHIVRIYLAKLLTRIIVRTEIEIRRLRDSTTKTNVRSRSEI